MSTERSHFWIPDSEVEKISNKKRMMTSKKEMPHGEHGKKLGKSLRAIAPFHEDPGINSLKGTDTTIFKVEIIDDQKVQNNEETLSNMGLQIKAVKDEKTAIVSTSNKLFEKLNDGIDKYAETGRGKTNFDKIYDFLPNSGEEKYSRNLARVLSGETPKELDVQIMLMPNLESGIYDIIIKNIKEKISRTEGTIRSEYRLSDQTPIIRAVLPSGAIATYKDDPAIYRIEKTESFDFYPLSGIDLCTPERIIMDPDTDLSKLPVVCVIDDGISFPEHLSALVCDKFTFGGGGPSVHGTKVAGRVVFGYITDRILDGSVAPRARVIDFNMGCKDLSQEIIIEAVRSAVERFSGVAKTFNLCLNANAPIEGDKMSIIGYEIDQLHIRFGIQFVLSTGNHSLWTKNYSLDEIIDDDDSRIAEPADSLHSICVGSIVYANHEGSISMKDDIAPYSRRGPGYRGTVKPDMVAYCGTILPPEDIPEDDFSFSFDTKGRLVPVAGTSFSAPVVSGIFAEALNDLPEENILLANVLLKHNLKQPKSGSGQEPENNNTYGRGVLYTKGMLTSAPSKVTFVRTGTMRKDTKEHIKIAMPEQLSDRGRFRVRVTCVTRAPIDHTKGTEYLGAYAHVSLKKPGDGDAPRRVEPESKEGRKKWDVCQQITKKFTRRIIHGDLEVWLELFSRWENKNDDVPYAIAITLEDTKGELDIHNEILAQNRYDLLNEIRTRVELRG
jgi:hypothetical protein